MKQKKVFIIDESSSKESSEEEEGLNRNNDIIYNFLANTCLKSVDPGTLLDFVAGMNLKSLAEC